jgi:hypothetical protein
MANKVYILTILVDGEPTRIQCGCTNELTMDMLCFAADRDWFVEFRATDTDHLPRRDDNEMHRMEKFIRWFRVKTA